MPPASLDKALDALAEESAELEGYFSDTPINPQPRYPKVNNSFNNAIVVANLPVVPQAKVEKLTQVLTKLVSKIGTLVTSENFNGVLMPYDGDADATLGFAFVEYATPEEAKNAVEVLQGYSFDKKHQLRVVQYSRAKQLQNFDPAAEFNPPQPEPFLEKPNPCSWLEDPEQRDSFVIRFQNETIVHWFDAKSDPIIDYGGSREKEAGVSWCEYYCAWSPAGSYLATLVPAKGVILWSGSSYEKVGRFVAPGVKTVTFSPQENYFFTNNENPDDPAAIKVYHIATGNLLRAFPLYPDGMSSDKPPPPFSWSHDDMYLARMGIGLISVYETPPMRLLDSRSLMAEGISDFQWCPKKNIIAYWAPEDTNAPAHVDLIEIPSRNKLRQKNLFNVTACNLVFSPSGDYLAVKVTRHTKSKKTFYNNIELFRLNAAGIPVEMLEVKDAVMALQWEPAGGSRFAMILAESLNASKVQVAFYDMLKRPTPTEISKKTKGQNPNQRLPELTHLETLSNKQCTCIYWSPAGSTILLASLGDTASGALEFYDVDTKSLVMKEHYRANQVHWDPAGRSVATCVTQPIEGGQFKFAMDNGYIIWSFQGKQLYQDSFETFFQFLWRPRESLLSKSQVKKVRQNLKKYEREFDRADRRRQRARYLEETAGKRAERSKIRDLLDRNRAIAKRNRARHVELLGGYDSDDEVNYVYHELTVETVLTSKEEVVM